MAAPPLMSPTLGKCEAAAPGGPLPNTDGLVSNGGGGKGGYLLRR